MSVEAPHNPQTTNPDEPESSPVIPPAPDTAASLLDKKVSRRGLLGWGIGGGALILGGIGLGAWLTNRPSEADPAPAPIPSPEASKSPEVDTDPLSPDNLWRMSADERMAAVRVDKELLDNPGYTSRFLEIQQAILNIGTTDASFSDWDSKFNKDGTGNYGEFIFTEFTRPLLESLWGVQIGSNLDNSVVRQIPFLVGTAAYARSLNLKGPEAPHYTTVCRAVSTPETAGTDISFSEEWSFPGFDGLSVALPKFTEEAGVNNTKKIMARKGTSKTRLSDVHYNAKKQTVQPSSVLHKFDWVEE